MKNVIKVNVFEKCLKIFLTWNILDRVYGKNTNTGCINMGIDGLTNLNLGLLREVTPSELLNYVKQDADEQASKIFKQIENSEKIKLNPDSQKKHENAESFEFDKKKENEDDETAPEQIISEVIEDKNRIACRLQDECVEIIDSNTGEVIEKISVEQLKKFFAHIKNPSGLLVDKSG